MHETSDELFPQEEFSGTGRKETVSLAELKRRWDAMYDRWHALSVKIYDLEQAQKSRGEGA